MGKPAYAITRVAISVVSQLLCGYSTLPLYAIVSHMGNSFKKSIFDDNVTEGLAIWAEKARRRRTIVYATNSSTVEANSGEIQMQNTRDTSLVEQGTTRLV
ncbi:hypothetical protein ACQ4PT_064203 [Festuca glaucescens]